MGSKRLFQELGLGTTCAVAAGGLSATFTGTRNARRDRLCRGMTDRAAICGAVAEVESWHSTSSTDV
jgi:hypothetical protein